MALDASFPFLIFSLAVVVAYNLSRSPAWRQSILALANLAFLATFSLAFKAYLPFAAFLLCGYIGVLLIRTQPRIAFWPVLLATITAFIWLKKYSFLPSSTFLHFTYVTIGLSYIFFRVLHLQIDTSSGEIAERIGPVTYFNYTCNFATLVTGPIQLYQDFKATPGLAGNSRLSFEVVAPAFERILRGIVKTNVLALVASRMRENAMDVLLTTSDPMSRVWSGFIVFAMYPIFVYCNFSGYIDIVIGVGELLGFHLPENFNRPFSARNWLDFWGQWHITLSNWLKRYVFNPMMLTLMRRFPSVKLEPFWAVLAYFVTFSLIGVWHGQTSEFVVYGLILGFGMSMNKLYQILMAKVLGRQGYKKLAARPWYRTACRGLTFTYFAMSLIWFWSTWKEMAIMYSRLGLGWTLCIWLAIWILSSIVLGAWEEVRQQVVSMQWDGKNAVESLYVRAAWGSAMFVMIIAVTLLTGQSAPDIVYKAF
jgi:D-alanyl-lipoteichoic acid acyltransferase DltB (MBOAT superfamily)